MHPFNLTLSNGAQLSGRASLPERTSVTPAYVPLLVGIHGGSYCSTYFDASASVSVAPVSTTAGIPFIAIDRPGYKESTSLPPVADSSTFFQDEGKYLHKFILPALWNKFGKDLGCIAIVLLTHSMGTPGTIVAAALHSEDTTPSYPLCGLIMSGWGTKPITPPDHETHLGTGKSASDRLTFPNNNIKDFLMFGPKAAGRANPEVFTLTEALGQTMSMGEYMDGGFTWFEYWLRYAGAVTIPIMYALSENDALWAGKEKHVQEYVDAFKKSPRLDRGLVLGAPHCLELSHWGKGWYLRCFGFASDCAVVEAVGRRQG